MRIFIDCTDTYRSTLNTGIQRVVRNLVNHSGIAGKELGVECIPVVLESGGYIRVSGLRYSSEKRAAFRLRGYLNDRYLRMVRGLSKWLPFPAFRNFLTASKHEFGLTQLILVAISPLIWAWRLRRRAPVERETSTPIFINPRLGDILLLADSFWNYNFRDAATEAKRSGATVVAIIYDIIPLSHPQLVDQRNKINFEIRVPDLYACADGFLCISDYTKHTLIDYFQTQSFAQNLRDKCFDFFHLGAELDAIDHKGNIREIIKKPFGDNASAYLIVGTVEPRKNHLYLLDAFNLLWKKDVQATLVIVGKVGWLCDNILEAIYSHPMYGIRLFYISDASDTELDYCYSHAKALLFPAIIEGFGLPIIEAQKKGLPVFASDIPVFREVAQDSAAYFDNTAPQALADMLLEYERTGVFPATGPSGFTWPSWEECTHQMLTRLIKMHQEIQSEQSQAQVPNKTSY